MEALRAAIASAGRDGGTTCLLSLTRHVGFLQLDDGVTAKVPSGVENPPASCVEYVSCAFDLRYSVHI